MFIPGCEALRPFFTVQKLSAGFEAHISLLCKHVINFIHGDAWNFESAAACGLKLSPL